MEQEDMEQEVTEQGQWTTRTGEQGGGSIGGQEQEGRDKEDRI